MKIAADYYEKGLGKSLGFLVGALVIGTAFPHLLKTLTGALPWKSVLIAVSSFAVLGGTLILALIPDGPYRKAGQKAKLFAFVDVFKNQSFRASAFGYFGHMWELYTFWAFVPIMLKAYVNKHPQANFNIPLLSFFIIGIGGLGCVMGGYLSQKLGTKRIASMALLLSGTCCLFSPLFFSIEPEWVFIALLLFWGIVVIADSPLFSTMVAQNAPSDIKGTALTIVNCIGFSITIVSIQLLNTISLTGQSNSIYIVLALGPVFGLMALRNNKAPKKI